jgi:hypothetical protein
MRKNYMFTYALICAMGIITAGCSSLPFVGDKSQKMVEIPEVKMDEIPAWFVEKEPEDGKNLTVTATDISKDMQFAIDKATLNAKVQLAQKLGTTVNAIVRESTLESGYGVKDVERDIDRVSKSKTEQKIGFYKRENLKVVRENGYFRAYVMLKLSIEEGRRLTQNTKSNQSREDRFKELNDTPPSNTAPVVKALPPVSYIDPSKMIYKDISDRDVKARVEKVLQDPNAVVISTTIN